MVQKKTKPKKKKVLGVRKPGRPITIRLPSVRNKLEAYATTAPIRWITGHGTMLSRHVIVPPKTFVVFLARPGFLTSGEYSVDPDFLKLWSDLPTMKKFIRGEITGPNHPPFRTWRNRIYGPGDRMPDTYIELFDLIGSGMREINTNEQQFRNYMDRITGVKRVGGGVIYHGLTTTVGNIIRKKGPGIYFVYACRGTVFQHPESLERVFRQRSEIAARDPTGFITLTELQDIRRSRAQTQRVKKKLKV